jgi:hypothetical protein
MPGTLRQYLGREHAVDPEQLKFDGVAAAIRCGIDKRDRAPEITAMVA